MEKYPFLPLRDFVLLPYAKATLFFGREKSIKALQYVMEENIPLIVTLQKEPKVTFPNIDEIYNRGVKAKLIELYKMTDGTYKAIIKGINPFSISKLTEKNNFIYAEGENFKEYYDWQKNKVEVEALMRNIISQLQVLAKVNKNINLDDVIDLISTENPYELAYGVMTKLNIKAHDKQNILNFNSLLEKLEFVYSELMAEIEVQQINKKIQEKVKNQIAKNQKEYYLQEQLNAIQSELGHKNYREDIDELENKLKNLKLSKEAREKVENELKKLRSMNPMSSEVTVIRNYLEWIADIPWEEFTEDEKDLTKVETILDEDHFGLEKVKERIVEYLAVKFISESNHSPILCFVGPPGVGKTSLGKSIARAMKRNFVRISLGGIKDEAEIRGHRRTYVGALPGKIIRGMKKAKSSNPVFMLDEIDKLSSDYRGDPASAMLEVLDPEQNHAFLDHYIDVDYDLSNVLFIATANNLDTIPAPLRDRMEIIKIEGYTEYEKLEIAKKYLIPNLLEETGLSNKININFSDSALLDIIKYYTREAGVRNLKREIEKILRKIAKDFIKNSINSKTKKITSKNLEKYLGVKKYNFSNRQEISKVGVTNGLAWTPTGGDVLSVEVSIMQGTGKLYITGKLGEIMQESVKAALSYVRTRADVFELIDNFYEKIDLHIHVPEGAIPKDGPSAGITIATSIVSALTNIPVKNEIAMTGEITLRGEILAIGGLKEKLLAAKRAGIRKVIIPEENIRNLKEIPDIIKNNIEIIPLKTMDEVLFYAFDLSSEQRDKLNENLKNFKQAKLYRLISKDSNFYINKKLH